MSGWADHWARRARAEGWRSRAVFKLAELDRRDRLFRRGARVADLGAAPGAWSQYLSRKVLPGGRVVAVDIELMEPLKGVHVLQGDVACGAVLDQVRAALGGRADAVISDLAPRLGGNRDFDQARSMELAAMALDAALELLRPQGAFVAKLFQGDGFEAFVAEARSRLHKVRFRTPAACRRGSRETYLVGRAA
ncbi:MAG: RlmE family RNA methyltransferase [Gammaproteobacteria bacterium]|nr:RlmE family RNA methyltransferase [Gammaproteobacteria bacterium]MCY4164903.1 RlmE family RNA methyltransferase [Gammaproteobacteria bacterium]MCY4340530.1 RlmE family RNA methyltransferase [Gammaproteobacteria bacterium]